MSDASHDSDTREDRFEAAVADYLQAVEEGRAVDPERFVRSFPDLASRLRKFFADQAAL
jgi:hypothetical protein